MIMNIFSLFSALELFLKIQEIAKRILNGLTRLLLWNIYSGPTFFRTRFVSGLGKSDNNEHFLSLFCFEFFLNIHYYTMIEDF
jgi:hypothetical protein